MKPEDLTRAASHFRRIDTPSPEARPYYEFVSGALVWTDELPTEPPDEWSAIRFVLRHRTCLLLQRPSPDAEWWDTAKVLFPNWVGFRTERCTPSEALRRLFLEAEAEAARALDRVFRPIENDRP